MKLLFDPMNQRGRIYTLNNDSELFLRNPYYTFKPASTIFSFETTQQVPNRLINGQAILHKDCLYKIVDVFNEFPMYC